VPGRWHELPAERCCETLRPVGSAHRGVAAAAVVSDGLEVIATQSVTAAVETSAGFEPLPVHPLIGPAGHHLQVSWLPPPGRGPGEAGRGRTLAAAGNARARIRANTLGRPSSENAGPCGCAALTILMELDRRSNLQGAVVGGRDVLAVEPQGAWHRGQIETVLGIRADSVSAS